MSKLKRCPHCGSEVVMTLLPLAIVDCQMCDSSIQYKDPNTAEARWNNRVVPIKNWYRPEELEE